jgi:hypothetical protein
VLPPRADTAAGVISPKGAWRGLHPARHIVVQTRAIKQIKSNASGRKIQVASVMVIRCLQHCPNVLGYSQLALLCLISSLIFRSESFKPSARGRSPPKTADKADDSCRTLGVGRSFFFYSHCLQDCCVCQTRAQSTLA